MSKHRRTSLSLNPCVRQRKKKIPIYYLMHANPCVYMRKSMECVASTRTDQSYVTAHLSISIRIYPIPTPGNQLLQTELIKGT